MKCCGQEMEYTETEVGARWWKCHRCREQMGCYAPYIPIQFQQELDLPPGHDDWDNQGMGEQLSFFPSWEP